MKNYPRIKRLSTLGIVHHQEFDYEFNAFRTDFVGEGGAGKSMISDLLQLIFVGTAVFHSPTKSTGERKPHTMVIKSEGKGTDMGYAFLNIEVAKDQYLVVGIYLESTGQSNAFIIQSGLQFNEEIKLTPFTSLLGWNDFILNGSILPLELVKDHIYNSLGLTCESWHHLTEYHKILYSNHILPLDLSKSRKTLENYAKIIQAFSREALDISKSERLQNFLFGDEKEKEFLKSFEKAIEELSGDVRQFEINSEEIDKLTHKQEKLQQLLKVKKQKDDNFEQLIQSKYHDCVSQIALNETKLTSHLIAVKNAETNLGIIKGIIKQKIDTLKKDIEDIELQHEKAVQEKFRCENQSNKVSKYFSWLKHFNCHNKELVERYENYHKSKAYIDKIRELQKIFVDKGILSFVETINLEEKNIISSINALLSDYDSGLLMKQSLKALNNINDQNSLAYWAINLGRKLTIEEESIVHKYHNQNIVVNEPSDTTRKYVPKPLELLDNIPSSVKNEEGMWLNLHGLFEFIPFVKEQIFNTDDIGSIKKYFEEQTRSLDIDITALEKIIANYKALNMILSDLDNPDSFIKAWNIRSTVMDSLEEHEMYGYSKEVITEYSQLMIDNLKIAEDTKKARADYKKIDQDKIDNNTLHTNLQKISDNFVDIIVPEIISALAVKYNVQGKESMDSDYFDALEDSSNYFDTISKILKTETDSFNLHLEIKLIEENLLELNARKKEIMLSHADIISRAGNTDLLPAINTLEQLDRQYQSSYLVKYNVLVDEFLKDQAKRFEDSGDFTSLCSAILPPEIFDQQEMLDEEIIENINKHLRDINLKNQSLNGRKLQKLSNIIDQVDKEVSEQLNDIRRIKNFFSADGMVITGGHHVYIEVINDNIFPREWMSKFTQQINSDFSYVDDALFSPTGITSELAEFPTLLEKMRQAFYKCGGSKSLHPKPEDLLNPKSYYDLKFSIKSMHGKKNDGSTSQTYAAISLLCMARLALLDRTQPKGNIRAGIRFMAIDEAEGLGSNFDMLYSIAKENDYQILSLSINPNKVDAENQNIYLLMNSEENEDYNYRPIPIFGLLNNVAE